MISLILDLKLKFDLIEPLNLNKQKRNKIIQQVKIENLFTNPKKLKNSVVNAIKKPNKMQHHKKTSLMDFLLSAFSTILY